MFLSSQAEGLIRIAAVSLMVLGVTMVLAGIALLIQQATGKAVQTIAAQTTRLAQKGLAEEVAGLVGNAQGLLDALNNLVRTRAGIGIFLILAGFLMIGASVCILFQLV